MFLCYCPLTDLQWSPAAACTRPSMSFGIGCVFMPVLCFPVTWQHSFAHKELDAKYNVQRRTKYLSVCCH